jgi:hypothetical protein
MIDLNIIREYYASMPEEKLIRFVKEDSHDLTDEALSLLKLEFEKRKLDINAFIPVRKEQSGEEERDPLHGSYYSGNNVDNAMQGLTYQEMMYPKKEPHENDEISLAKLTEENLKELVEKNHNAMLKNGVICVIGLGVTLVTLFIAEDKGGSYVVAWGAILFGGIGFFRALGAKEKFQSALNDNAAKKDELPEN